jgi:hypothetical protein
MALDPEPNGKPAAGRQGIVSATVSLAVSMTLTVSLAALATKTNRPFGLAIMPQGWTPTAMDFVAFQPSGNLANTETLP